MTGTANPFPHSVSIEHISVDAFDSPESLFERVKHEARTSEQSAVFYLNVHVANTAKRLPILRRILQRGDVVYCDGAGIVAAAKMTGQHLPTRLTSADWVLDMLDTYAQDGLKVFLLGGEPGVPEAALDVIDEKVPGHSVVGVHHGFILKDSALEQQVIDQINALQPDILIVGFGTPLQEFWIDRNRHRLNVPVVYAIGAVMDFLSGKLPRCPEWMGKNGLEWAYRFYSEPRRLFGRYMIGNFWFMGRVATSALFQRAASSLPRPAASLKKQPTP